MSLALLTITSSIDAFYAVYLTGIVSKSTMIDTYIDGANSIALIAFNKSAGIGIIFAFVTLGLLIGSCIACCICCGGCCQCCRPKSDQTIRYFSQAPSPQPYNQPYNQPASQPINQPLIA